MLYINHHVLSSVDKLFKVKALDFSFSAYCAESSQKDSYSTHSKPLKPKFPHASKMIQRSPQLWCKPRALPEDKLVLNPPGKCLPLAHRPPILPQCPLRLPQATLPLLVNISWPITLVEVFYLTRGHASCLDLRYIGCLWTVPTFSVLASPPFIITTSQAPTLVETSFRSEAVTATKSHCLCLPKLLPTVTALPITMLWTHNSC